LIGEPGESVFSEKTFIISGGIAPDATQIDCQVTSGKVQIGAFPQQTVSVDQTA
jgi:hypothetical protein